jgi:hypothetical protein
MVSEVEELVKLLSWSLMIVEQVVEVNPPYPFHSMNSKITFDGVHVWLMISSSYPSSDVRDKMMFTAAATVKILRQGEILPISQNLCHNVDSSGSGILCWVQCSQQQLGLTSVILRTCWMLQTLCCLWGGMLFDWLFNLSTSILCCDWHHFLSPGSGHEVALLGADPRQVGQV